MFNTSLTRLLHDVGGKVYAEKGLGAAVNKRPLTVLAISAAGFLTACGGVPGYTMVDGAVVVATDKTIADNVISLASGKDCSLVRKERGMTYCVEDEVIPRPEVYCYRELAGVTCYDKPDTRRGDRGRLGDNDHNLVKK